jgi:hypothetical protein
LVVILTALKRIGLAPSISTTGSVKARLMLSRDQAAELLEVRPTLWWREVDSNHRFRMRLTVLSG